MYMQQIWAVWHVSKVVSFLSSETVSMWICFSILFPFDFAIHPSCIASFVTVILPIHLVGILLLAALPMWFEMKRRVEEAVKQENSVASVYGAPPRHQGGGASTTPLSPHTANSRILTSHTGEPFYALTLFMLVSGIALSETCCINMTCMSFNLVLLTATFWTVKFSRK